MNEFFYFGKTAEQEATNYLRKKGHKILKRNYRYLKAEIDIITEFCDMIIIVEVKARSENYIVSPEQAVNKKKQALIITAANQFMNQAMIDKNIRFDIITVIKSKNYMKINHIEDAYSMF